MVVDSGKVEVVIVGGGLAGLTSAINLAQKGHEVVLVEKNSYPFHKVCGEYVSNEVRSYLAQLGFCPEDYGAKEIGKLHITGVSGVLLTGNLEMGAFGISRYRMDYALYEIGLTAGVTFILGEEVTATQYKEEVFLVKLKSGRVLRSSVVLAAYGKRSKLDKKMNRRFMKQRSPYVGVKYHIKTDAANDRISLHNFTDGYCGMSAIEEDLFCLCYLTERSNFDLYKSVENVEKEVLCQNPYLKQIFSNAQFVYKKPLVINEISFAAKTQVEDHVLMMGDTAGLIAPLCGNGMAIAIHGGKLAAEAVTGFLNGVSTRATMENTYQTQWKNIFSRRLWAGRNIQKLFGANHLTNGVLHALKTQEWLLNKIIKATHGQEVM